SELRRLGVKFGKLTVYLPGLLKPEATQMKLTLRAVALGQGSVAPPAPGHVAYALDGQTPDEWLTIAGFRRCGAKAIRIDMLERLDQALRERQTEEMIIPTGELTGLVGCSNEEFVAVMRALGYEKLTLEDETVRYRIRGRRGRPRPAPAPRAEAPAAPEAAPAAEGTETPPEGAIPEDAIEGEAGTEIEAEAEGGTEAGAEGAPGEPRKRRRRRRKPRNAHAEGQPVAVAEGAPMEAAEAGAEAAVPTDAAVPSADDAAGEVPAEDGEATEPKLIGSFAPQPKKHPDPRDRRKKKRKPRPPREEGQAPRAEAGGEQAAASPPAQPPRQHQEARQSQGPRPQQGPRHHQGPKGGKGQQGGHPGNKPRRHEPPPPKVDPDSPFAKLMALRDKLGGK
ncbi:MAG: hypothetical protein PHS60_16625, partial [Zavarzinia sp.]|nr:hypothetical protein [Zavarzinia sp.]